MKEYTWNELEPRKVYKCSTPGVDPNAYFLTGEIGEVYFLSSTDCIIGPPIDILWESYMFVEHDGEIPWNVQK